MSPTEYLDQLDQAREKATPGEWHVARGGGIDAGDYDTVIGRGDVDCMAHCYGGTSTIEGDNLAADAALIVAAVNALPDLTRAARERDALRQAVLDLAEELDATVLELGRLGDLKRTADRIRAVLTDALGGAE